MKKTTITLLLSLSCCWLAAQCPTNVLFQRQGQIDSFQINYPGCTDIPGLVGILDFQFAGDTIFNLNGLSSIETIGGYLEIGFNSFLTSLEGLNNLASVGGFVNIAENNALLDLSGLENLRFIGQHLELLNNKSLMHLNGLNKLDSLLGDLWISDNALNSLEGLHNLSFIGGNLDVQATPMTELNGLENLTQVAGSVNFLSNHLTNLNGLEKLANIGGYLQIEYNDFLTDLSGLNHLTTVGGYLSLSHNGSLSDLNGFNSLKSVAGGLEIAYNSTLNTISGFASLDTVGCLYLGYNQELISLNGLNHLSKIGGCFEDLGDFSTNLGGLVIVENPSLPDLGGLDGVSHVEGCLRIDNNENLNSLNGLGSLQYVGGECGIGSDSIGSIIRYNYTLATLEGLDKLETISRLEISDNFQLSTCNTPPICAYLQNGGLATFSNNATGCYDLPEVLTACLIPTNEAFSAESPLQILPNPATDFLQIQIKDLEAWDISGYDLQGRQMFRQSVCGSRIIRVKDWPSGVYAVRAVSGGRVFAGKVVMQ